MQVDTICLLIKLISYNALRLALDSRKQIREDSSNILGTFLTKQLFHSPLLDMR